MRLLVTGGAGFIGANLALAAVERGWDVTVLDDFSTGRRTNLDGAAVAVHEGSILDRAALDRASVGADAIVHLAAVTSVPYSIEHPDRTHAVNVDGTAAVLEAANRRNSAVVFASSAAVYGNAATLPVPESAPAQPHSPYAGSKLTAEDLVLRSGLDVFVARFFNVYGPHQAPDHPYAAVIPAFVDALLFGRPLVVYGDGRQSRDFVPVRYVTDVLLAALEQRLTYGGPVNLASGSRTSIVELIDVLQAVTGRTAAVEHRPARAGDVRDSYADITLLCGLVPGAVAETFESGLRRTVDWFERR